MAWYDIFGGGIVKSIENIAMEAIETDKESAEAKALLYKSIDPNGMMRKQISKDIITMYKVYLFTSMFLIALQFILGLYGSLTVEQTAIIQDATSKLTDLFLPITSMVGIIVGASFGVNYANVKKGI